MQLICPACFGPVVKNGRYEPGRIKYLCKICGTQTAIPINPAKADEKTQLRLGQGRVIPLKHSDFDLYLTSDWHAGSNVCDFKALKKMTDRIEGDPMARVIIGGDQMEMTPPDHHDGGRESVCYPDQQIIRTAEALQSLKSRVDLIYAGNHGRARFLRQSQIDPDLLLAYTLGVAYSTVPTVIQYRTPKGTVKICGGHGRSGAANSKLEIERMQAIFPGCALYHLGHTHDLYAEQQGAMVFDDAGLEHWSGTWFCRTGSFLRYAEYARFAMMKPKPTGYLVAHIRAGRIEDVDVVKT